MRMGALEYQRRIHTVKSISTLAELSVLAGRATAEEGLWLARHDTTAGAPASRPTYRPTYLFVSFAEFEARARRCAFALQREGLAPRERIAFIVPSAEHAVTLMLGIWRAGMVAVPIVPPMTASELENYSDRVNATLQACGTDTLVIGNKIAPLIGDLPGIRLLSFAELGKTGEPQSATPVNVEPDAVAVVQPAQPGARGSLGDQPIELSHADLLEQLASLTRVLAVTEHDAFASWLPPFRDAGLLCALLPFFCGRPGALVPTPIFLKHPQAWLHAITHARATIAFAPDHGYAFCAQRLSRTEAEGIDLSRWRLAGAVSDELAAATRQAFADSFTSAGFDARAFDGAPVLRPFVRSSNGPLSVGQKVLWFLGQMAPESDAYHVANALRIRSPLDRDALRKALEAIVARHPALRTVFPATGGEPVRRLLHGSQLSFEEVDVSNCTEAELLRKLRVQVERPFDLERGPLFVARVFVRSPNDAVVLLVAHHINVDAHSLILIGTEFTLLYGLYAAGQAPELPPIAHDYDDFVRYQAQLLANARGQELRRYWRRKLEGAPVSSALPTDRPRPPRQTYRGATLAIRLDDKLAHALREVAQRHDTTLYPVALAAYMSLLHRYSGQRDLVVAAAVAGRNHANFTNVVGYFINMVPVRAQLEPSTTFEQLIKQLSTTVYEALDHQDLPFALAVEEARVPRDPRYAPLCQLMFQLHSRRGDGDVANIMKAESAGGVVRYAGLDVELVDLDRRTAQYDLALNFTEDEGRVGGWCEYNVDLFDEATVQQLLRDFVTLAGALAQDPGATIGSHRLTSSAPPPVLDAGERALVLEHWNATEVSYPQVPVQRAFEEQVERTPGATALSFGDATLSYRELNNRANRIARHLRAQGVSRESLVGVAMERSLELPAILLAILKAGGAYVPLDPTYPADRLRFMAEDAQPALIVADRRHVSLLEGGSAPLQTTEALLEVAQAGAIDASNLQDEPGADLSDLAYVIYTSGSTGAPKGAANTHAGLANRLHWMQERFALGTGDCVLQKTPYSFDVSVWEFFWPLMTGARLAVARPEGHKDSSYLLAEIEQSRVTTVHFVPSMLDALLREPDVSRAAGLSRVVCSGEALPYALLERFVSRLPGVELHNLYGPTEAAIDVTAWRCEPNAGGSVPIGRPVANTQIYILDPQRQPVGVGETGELYIAGVQLARGYHRRPELTAERFVANPFSAVPGARMYRTGDLARWRADGQLEYLGRNDDQVKIRGFRIELGEIETALGEQPGVGRAVAIARPMASGGTRIEAFVVPAPGAHPQLDALPAALARRLPDYMVPARVHAIEVIPLTHSGKADRQALLSRAAEAEVAPAGRVPPRTSAEAALAAVFQEVLGIPEVGVHDNYFKLGGDSIRSLQVRALARARGLDFQIQALFEHQTVAELAQVVGATGGEETYLEPFALVAAEDRTALAGYEDAFPTTRMQLGMLYHSELSDDSWAYHDIMSHDIELPAAFDEAAMRRSLEQVVHRHPVLRSCFDLGTYSEPLQLIQRTVSTPMSTHDLRGASPQAARAAIDEYITRDKAQGFSISQAPLFRLTVHELDGRRIRATLSFHHAILDGWSTATFMRELFTGYLVQIGVSGLPHFTPPAHGFAELVALERAAIESAESRAYWASRLEDCELTRLPRWPGETRSTEPGAHRLFVEIDRELSDRLQSVAGDLHSPIKALLLAAHARALAAFSGCDEVITGRVVHGRPEFAEAERVLGLFLNTLPVRLRLANKSWRSLIAEIVQQEHESHPHRRFPLSEILRLVDQKALFETAFNFVNFHLYDELVAEGSLGAGSYEVHENTGFALLANFARNPKDGSLGLHVEYDAQQIAPEQAEAIAQGHVLALSALVHDLDGRVSEAAVLPQAEIQRVLQRSSGSITSGSAPSVLSLLSRSARATPDAVAVQLGAESLNYRELDALAVATAQRLIAAGAGPGEAIGVCAQPSLERAVALLGILKAGCAYLPLDPAFPADRLDYMLGHAGVRIVLSTQKLAQEPFLADRAVVVLQVRQDGRADLEAGADTLAAESQTEPEAPLHAHPVTPDTPAYVIYTSGSTGRPKGIVMHHAPLSHLVAWQVAESTPRLGHMLGHMQNPATAQLSSFSFDVSLQEMLATLASGGRLVMVPEECRKDPRRLVELLAKERVARVFMPVVALQQLAEVAEDLALELPDLREINVAGEQLEITAAVRAFFARHGRCALSNHYGPSETHVATAHRLDGTPEAWPTHPPIGRPLPGVSAYILDTHRQPVPVGVPGEIYLGGACVGSGYCNDAALTEQRFVPDPFAHGGRASRMYRTGDLARHLPDGAIEFLGRCDGQVKIRGYRVEPSEIEAAILDQLGDLVKRAAVVAVPGRSRATRLELAAYVELQPNTGLLELETLNERLARSLPAHMLPSSLTVLDALPLTGSGKVARRALPAPQRASGETIRTKVAPSTQLETELCGIWQEVLVAGDPGVTDDFFASGGDSLSAVRLVARVQRRYGIELPISVLVGAPTIRQLAHAIENSGRAEATPCLVLLNAGDAAREPLFCMHPLGGNVLCYIPLARHLGKSQPCYGLQARGLDGRAAPHTSLVEMAADYTAEILAAQPEGTVHLAGWSFGGLTAVEVARQLQRAGRVVAPVAVIDTMAAITWQVQPTDEAMLEAVAFELFGAGLSEEQYEELLTSEGELDTSERYARMLASARARGLLPEDADFGSIEHIFEVIRGTLRGFYSYQQSEYHGEIVLLRCSDPMPARLQRAHDLVGSTYQHITNGWDEYCSRLERFEVPGNHLTVINEPHVAKVAEVLRHVLGGHRVRAERPQPPQKARTNQMRG